MQEVEVIINDPKEGVATCTTVNPFGEKPVFEPLYVGHFPDQDYGCQEIMSEWQQAESERKTYEIDFSKLSNAIEALENAVGGKVSHVSYGYEPGTIHQARIENGKATIL